MYMCLCVCGRLGIVFFNFMCTKHCALIITGIFADWTGTEFGRSPLAPNSSEASLVLPLVLREFTPSAVSALGWSVPLISQLPIIFVLICSFYIFVYLFIYLFIFKMNLLWLFLTHSGATYFISFHCVLSFAFCETCTGVINCTLN